MKTRNANGVGLSIPMLAFALVSMPCNALEYGGSLRVGVGLTDNVARTPVNNIDETLAIVGFDFDAQEDTNRVDLNLRSSFDYVEYLDNTFESEVIGGLAGTALITLIDERLQWLIQENFGQQLFDPLQPDRPGNREDINFFTTGPTATLFFGSRNFLNLDARYSRVTYELQPSDNKRVSGAIELGRTVGRDTSLSVNVQGERIEFDDRENLQPIDGYAVFLRYAKTGLRNTVSIDLGYNGIESSGVEGDGVLFEASWTRETSANGLLTMVGGSKYSDQGNIFRLLQNIAISIADVNDLPDTSDPFLNYYYAVTYRLEQARYTIDVNGSWSQEDYKGQNGLDRDLYFGNFFLQREVSRTVFSALRVRFQRRDFKYIDRRDDDLTLGILVGYRFTPRFDLTLEYQHFQRNSIDLNADFTENRVFLTATYTPVPRARNN